jgi:hypothetical protein
LQCHDCGLIVARFEVSKEPSIKDVVSTTDNPFNDGKEFLGVDNRKVSRKKRQSHDYDYITDENLKRELRHSSKLLSYTEQLPQQLYQR